MRVEYQEGFKDLSLANKVLKMLNKKKFSGSVYFSKNGKYGKYVPDHLIISSATNI